MRGATLPRDQRRTPTTTVHAHRGTDHQRARRTLDGQQAATSPRYSRQTPTTAARPPARGSTPTKGPRPTLDGQAHPATHAHQPAARPPRSLDGQPGPRPSPCPRKTPSQLPTPAWPRDHHALSTVSRGSRSPRCPRRTPTTAERPPAPPGHHRPAHTSSRQEEEHPDGQVPAVHAMRPRATRCLSTVSEGPGEPGDARAGGKATPPSRRSAVSGPAGYQARTSAAHQQTPHAPAPAPPHPATRTQEDQTEQGGKASSPPLLRHRCRRK